ncbi:hypothetical protein [Streptomyces sp. NBC_00893]|uniref:hypothetical protein n=1 Tax=Streptomyces sp. NBC_00893 TaxID=2975862 RepID=UPI00225146C0|nr:hypothetical protein [Streptomyces sp. NBC_00893]MCX4851960.1 hypothetical protein [Streptomyces sp. NBC_00893]
MTAKQATARLMAATLLTGGLAGFLPVVAAGPAQATSSQCTSYLSTKGYEVGDKTKNICKKAADDGSAGAYQACGRSLLALGVTSSHAREACRRAVI